MSIFSLHFHSGKPRGFTLIELMVVIAIMTILTVVLLFRQQRFDSSTLLRSLTYSVGLSVRQAQVYGTSVFGTTTSSGVVFAPGYGIYFNWGSGSPTSYVLFADLNNSGAYDSGEDVKVFNLNNGFVISNVCVTTVGTPTQYCTADGLTSLSIVYRRPNPEACFSTTGTGGTNNPAVCVPNATAAFTSATVQLKATTGDAGTTRSIYISGTGQISVNTQLGS